MYARAARFTQLRHLLIAVCVIAVVGGAVLVGLGIVRFSTASGPWFVIVGSLVILLSILLAVLSYIALKIDANTLRAGTAIRDLQEAVELYGAKLDAVAESARLSDAAKSIAHRDEELIALRSAIDSQIALHDWEAARHLISDMERRFGYKEEVERLRDRVNRACNRYYNEEVGRAIPRIQQLFDEHKWDLAAQEIGRLLAAFPNEPRFTQLREELERRREQRKEQLVEAFTRAVQRDDIDIDAGMEILKELDHYLTREEAAGLEEAARKVVRGKLLQLGVRFRFAVNEERWRDALEVGVAIIEEFPNSRMAREVADRLDVLKERAGMRGDVEISTPTTATNPS